MNDVFFRAQLNVYKKYCISCVKYTEILIKISNVEIIIVLYIFPCMPGCMLFITWPIPKLSGINLIQEIVDINSTELFHP